MGAGGPGWGCMMVRSGSRTKERTIRTSGTVCMRSTWFEEEERNEEEKSLQVRSTASTAHTTSAVSSLIIDTPEGETPEDSKQRWGGYLQSSSSGSVIHREACRSDCEMCLV